MFYENAISHLISNVITLSTIGFELFTVINTIRGIGVFTHLHLNCFFIDLHLKTCFASDIIIGRILVGIEHL
jgi:hypothetical protein